MDAGTTSLTDTAREKLRQTVERIERLEEEKREVAEQIAYAVAPHARQGVALALPGASVIVIHVLAFVHGITGQWPRVAWSARQDGKFVWSATQVVDLHELRTEARAGERV